LSASKHDVLEVAGVRGTVIDRAIDSYESANKQKQYKKPSCKEPTF